ncbi:MAG: calcineurin-like phosphoesterase C-terminal domain-containing protein, partial [Candidatus Hydrogenedentes bacterium]|nr:calcineurin-like phosphoesterase C-terminal domain-containing protein [Candidatus Hydrogenedentota bacterium]
GDAGPWTEMTRVSRPDPFYVRLKEAEDKLPEGMAGGLPKPGNSTHLWAAPLPDGLPAGCRVIYVRTTDMFGQTYTGRRTVRVE